MDFKKETTHVLIKFNKIKKCDKTTIDLIPISWTYIEDKTFYCKYPNKNEYNKIDQMSKMSSIHKVSWKSFEITLIKEARNYDQGVKYMKKAFSDTVIQSSTIEEENSSEGESYPSKLSGDELGMSLKDIPSFSKQYSTTEIHKVKGNDALMFYVPTSDSSDASEISNRQKKKLLHTKNSPSFKRLKQSTNEKKTINDASYSQSEMSTSESSDASVITNRQKKKLLQPKTSSSFKRLKANEEKTTINDADYLQTNTLAPQSAGTSINAYSHTKSKYCQACGRSDEDLPVSKSDLESLRRSIEYRIKEESKITRTLLSTTHSTTDLNKILKDALIDLPKTTLDKFKDFDDQLNIDIDLIKNLKCFMVINIRGMVKISENLTTVIPKIMNKDVQVMYSAFGRETNGIKKLNFSETNTYKYLLEVLASKFPEVSEKEFAATLSRWFSGAKDRDGGKKERMAKKNISLT
ncbi:uncharacterized protein LOC100568806 [Acyrthosiphon pisum]|uniref:Uncharacterized protein n=1 Tax=Acyrthosiphon pisum TaxID=7029 RepID=A0A8R2B889_ACYPI|nr:uncharacterized protein LOC100568806 [Acyrthosiphon pisum]XP_029346050.1 uncharacterized protein LOC100568806 [Acyrthosiphon pisum]|eukprot:XP_008185906.2 PREDICTED: uncharacterized protein LOC100568806 [Acyrthosiphon pisum]